MAIALLVAAGCDGVSCRANAVPALRVHIVDGTGAPVCDATVVAHDGSFRETLRALPGDPPTPCFSFGPMERRGSYRIEATKPGATATATKVKVTADACHVITQDVTLTLTA